MARMEKRLARSQGGARRATNQSAEERQRIASKSAQARERKRREKLLRPRDLALAKAIAHEIAKGLGAVLKEVVAPPASNTTGIACSVKEQPTKPRPVEPPQARPAVEPTPATRPGRPPHRRVLPRRDSEFVSAEEISALFHVPLRTVRDNWAYRPDFPPFELVDGEMSWRQSDVRAWSNQYRTPENLTTADAAQLLRIQPRTLLQTWLGKPGFPVGRKIGRGYLFSAAEIRAYIASIGRHPRR